MWTLRMAEAAPERVLQAMQGDKVVVAEGRGRFGTGSANDAYRHAGASQILSIRIHQLRMHLTVKSVLNRCRCRKRAGVQDRIDHGSPHKLDTEALTGRDTARPAFVRDLLNVIGPSNREGMVCVVYVEG